MSATPEDAAAAFLDAWARRNWKAMHAVVQVSQRHRATPQALRETFGGKRLMSSVIGSATPHTDAAFLLDKASGERHWYQPDAVKVGASIVYRLRAGVFRRTVALVVAREDPGGRPTGPDQAAEWGVNDLSALRET